MCMDNINFCFINLYIISGHLDLFKIPFNTSDMNYRKIAEQIFLAGVNSVTPDRLIHTQLKLAGSTLKYREICFYPGQNKPDLYNRCR